MGTRTSMDCPCGFLAQVEYGCGMAIGYDAVFPHFCTKCGLVSASINKPNPSCPSCGSHEIAMYGERRASPPPFQGCWMQLNNALSTCGHMTRELQSHKVVRSLTGMTAELQWAGTFARRAGNSIC